MAYPLINNRQNTKSNKNINTMTLLRVYNKNGNKPASDAGRYMYSDLMRDFFGDARHNYSAPRVNILENNDSFDIQMAVPGIKKENVSIDVDKDLLTVAHNLNEENAEECYTRKEFDFNHFERSFNLPDSVHTEKIKASMENGILNIHLPKKEESIDKGPREIKIS